MERDGFERNDFDAIVIGSGFAGGVTACRLSEAGLRVCIVERGRRYGSDDLPVIPTNDQEAPSDFSRFAWSPGHGLWDFRDLGDLTVGQAAGYGGGSLVYANVHLRAPRRALASWPAELQNGALEPYFDLAAYMLQVSAVPDALDIQKTTAFEDSTKGLGHSFRPPLAVNFDESLETNPISGRRQGACDLAGECLLGCRQQAKNSIDLNYLALAEDAGAAVHTLAEVVSIRRVEDGFEVRYRDHLTDSAIAEPLRSRYVFLCAGAVNTTELLFRSRTLEDLPIEGGGLGEGYYPNADDVAVVFDTNNLHEPDRGPTITSAVVHDRDGHWAMLQDGGMPTDFLPWLGTFRSPLLLARNRFREHDDRRIRDREGHGFANLPGATSAIGALAELLQDPEKSADGRWSVLPDQLHKALDAIRLQSLSELSAGLEPTVARALIQSATDSELADQISSIQASQDSAQAYDQLPAMTVEMAIRLAFGSRSGMAQFLASQFIDRLVPWGDQLSNQAIDFLSTLLDFRYVGSHTSLLLTMGMDSTPGSLHLKWADVLPAGARIRGRQSKSSAIVLAETWLGEGSDPAVDDTIEVLILPLSGDFTLGESLEFDGRDLGRCAGMEWGEETGAGARRDAGPGFIQGSDRVSRVRSARLSVTSVPSKPIPRDPTPSARASSMTIRMTESCETPVRSIQERLMRDAAQTMSGELRISPLWSGFGKRISVHNQGGCRMSADPQDGVTSLSGEVHGCEGLYVMDAAAFPGPVGVNPTASILAVAEWKAERFVQDVVGISDWSAAQSEAARRWADARRPFLDPLEHDPDRAIPTESPRVDPIGIEFHERMLGQLESGGSGATRDASIVFDLGVAIPDLELFLSSHRLGEPIHAVVDGQIRIEGDLAGWLPSSSSGDPLTQLDLRVDPTTSRLGLFVERDTRGVGPGYRSLAYWLDLEVEVEVEGHTSERFLLAGRKEAPVGAEGEPWSALSTLPFALARVGDADSMRSGVVRLPAAIFVGEQLKGMRATGTTDPAQLTWAMTAFSGFFLKHVVELYAPGAERASRWLNRIMRSRDD
jgi:choline dehydrogenase-like flavoprotein